MRLRGADLVAAAIFSPGKTPPSRPIPLLALPSPQDFSAAQSSAVHLRSRVGETYKSPYCPRQRKCPGAANVNMAVKEGQRIGGGAGEVMLAFAKQGGGRRWVISRELSRLGSARKPQGGRAPVGPSACCRVRKSGGYAAESA